MLKGLYMALITEGKKREDGSAFYDWQKYRSLLNMKWKDFNKKKTILAL